MSEHAVAQQQTTDTLQRITSNALNFQRQAVNHDEPTALPELKLDTLFSDFAEPRLGFDFSQVPTLTGMVQQNRPLLHTQPMVQRAPKDEAAAGSSSCPTCPEVESEQISAIAERTAEAVASAPEATPTPVTSEPVEETATPGETASPRLIVEDSVAELATGQMKKSEFLSQLRAEVCRTVEAALSGTGRTTDDCPYFNHWFDFYSRKESAHIERAIHRYAPEASNATTAGGYISAVTQRARQSAETWVRTGEITGVPQGIPIGLSGTGLLGGIVSGIGSIFFKASNGGDRAADDPQAIQRELGEGRPLDSGVRSRMGFAFGTNFSHVRTHTDNTASELSNRFNARAFTVGEHVAFGAGEYKPGTLFGDALIAHELAHVVQQGATTSSALPKTKNIIEDNALEDEADRTAIGTVMSLWRRSKQSLTHTMQNSIPRLHSGLRLQRCAITPIRRERLPEPLLTGQESSEACGIRERQSMERINDCCTASMLREIGAIRAQAIPILEGTVEILSSSPADVSDQLWEHYRIRPNDRKRFPVVLHQFINMLSAMRNNDLTIYICRDKNEDPLCRRGLKRAQTVPTCTVSGPFYLHFCGDYVNATRSDRGQYLSGDDWVRTFIHEYAHIGCSPSTPIYPANQEFYRQGDSYPIDSPDRRIRNADCYAWFAMSVRNSTVSRSRRRVHTKLKERQTTDPLEQEADRIAEAAMNMPLSGRIAENTDFGDSLYRIPNHKHYRLNDVGGGIQFQRLAVTPPSMNDSEPLEQDTSSPFEERTQLFITDDDSIDLSPGQMRKGEFLAELQSSVCHAVDSALSVMGRTTDGCPYLSRWFNYYSERTPEQVEQAIHRYAPETRRVSSAREYIPIITEHARHSVERWAQTGEITGLPEGMVPGLLGMGLSGIAGGLLSGIASFGASLVQGPGRLFSGISGIFFKSRNSDTEEVDNTDVIQTELGDGQSLDSGIRLRMESAFGMDFSHVRIHTDSSAAILSDRFNARAFTLGKHIAFGSGEYKPYTPVGDALIAHEMAHVVQQGAAPSSSTPMAKSAAKENSLEEEADLSAINAVTSLLSGVNGKISQIRTSALPRLKSGLKLQRCATTRSQVRVQVQSLTDLASITPWQLSQVSDEQFNRLSVSRRRSGEPGIEDYRRARQLVRAVFRAYNVTFDIDNPPSTPLGRVPTPRELRILDANLTQILASGGGNIRRLVSGPGGRGVPTHGTSRTPTLEGRVRITRTLGEFVAKRYQLETLVSSGLRQNTALLDSEVAVLWRQFSIQPGSSPHITDQERRVAIFKLLEASAAGFYHPPDDTIYFPPTVNLSMPATRDIARHETVHLLGGRERTRQAFIRRFGTADYMRYWEPFEEGMAEFITQESRPVGQRVPSTTIATSRSGSTTVTVEAGGSQYEQYVQWIGRLIALDSRNRDLLLQAFFTGNLPATVFRLLIRNPPPAR